MDIYFKDCHYRHDERSNRAKTKKQTKTIYSKSDVLMQAKKCKIETLLLEVSRPVYSCITAANPNKFILATFRIF